MPMSDYMRRVRAGVGTMLLEIPAVALAIRDAEGRVLLGRHRSDGRWVLPGGAIEPLETPADSAVREAWEETGLYLELGRIVGVYGGPDFRVRYPNGDEVAFVVTVFEARAAGEPVPDLEELLELAWSGPGEEGGFDLARWVPRVLLDVFGGGPETAYEAPRSRPEG
jgi:8-oxo-dGTP pyrophosphatase MutT (NUDIX family)